MGVLILIALLPLSGTVAHGKDAGLVAGRARGFQPQAGTPPITVAAVGDGAGGNPNDTKVSDLIIGQQPDIFVYLGDVYDKGTEAEYAKHYEPTFGRLRSITNPTPGNHDYKTADAAGYFAYWDNIPSYYSYDSDGWHFISLDSAGPASNLEPGSAQYEWLANDLKANTLPCTLAYYHHPRYSIGQHGDNANLADVWQLLAQKGVDVTISGHDHDYQRWQPLDGSGNPIGDAGGGVTQFIAGTGGGGVREIRGSDVRVAAQAVTYGALFLELSADHLDFRFVNLAGEAIDSGTVACGGAAAPEAAPAPPPDAAPANAPLPANTLAAAANTAVEPAQGRALTFAPVADAYVTPDKPDTNYGDAPLLRADGSPTVRAFLRFDLQGLTGTVTKATLRMWANAASKPGYEVQGAGDNGWTESEVTYNNASAPEGDAIPSGSVAQEAWTETDVTSLLQANGAVNLVISGRSSGAISFSSRTGDHPPQLVVETDAVASAGLAQVAGD